MISSNSLSVVRISYSNAIIHRYTQPLLHGQLMTRYKRFLADVEFDNIAPPSSSTTSLTQLPATTTVHCPNTGTMLGLLPSESNPRRCACVDHSSSNSKRKYNYTLEMIQDRQETWVGIHSAFANKLVKQAIVSGYIDEIGLDFNEVNSEVAVKGNSKIDFEIIWKNDGGSHVNNSSNGQIEDNTDDTKLIASESQPKTQRKRKSNVLAPPKLTCSSSENSYTSRRLLLEVKSVTLAVEVESKNSRSDTDSDNSSTVLSAQFPDCVSERAQKHTKFLTEYVLHEKATNGIGGAAILFLIQRDDCVSFSASHYDIEYRRLLSEAHAAGVLILPYNCKLDPVEGTVTLLGKVPFVDTYTPSSVK